jgi:hypothetical protein
MLFGSKTGVILRGPSFGKMINAVEHHRMFNGVYICGNNSFMLVEAKILQEASERRFILRIELKTQASSSSLIFKNVKIKLKVQASMTRLALLLSCKNQSLFLDLYFL